MRRMTLSLIAAVMAGPAFAADTVKIGLVTTLTTPASVIGRDVVDAVNLAIEHAGGTIAGKKIELIIEDDGLKPDLGRQKAEKLVRQDKVDIVAGFNWSNVLLAARKPVLDSGKILISTNAGPSDMAGKLCHENFFSTRAQNDMVPMAVGQALNASGIKKLYVMAPNYAAGKDMVEGLKRTYRGEVVGSDYTKWGDDPQLDFSAELAKAKASNAEALFAFYPGRTGLAFARQFDQTGLAARMKLFTVYTLDQLALPALQEAGAKSVLGSETADYWSPDIDTPGNKRFVTDFRSKHGRVPSNYAAAAYDLIPYVKAAIEQSGGDVSDVARVRTSLRKADYDSVRGRYQVGQNGFPIDRFYRVEVSTEPSGAWTLRSKGVVLENTPDPYIGACKLRS
jgi:branched-chain amino acid transport system substrate-binding protein